MVFFLLRQQKYKIMIWFRRCLRIFESDSFRRSAPAKFSLIGSFQNTFNQTNQTLNIETIPNCFFFVFFVFISTLVFHFLINQKELEVESSCWYNQTIEENRSLMNDIISVEPLKTILQILVLLFNIIDKSAITYYQMHYIH